MSGSGLVARILADSGLSKTALCATAGVSRSSLDDYLRGRSQPSWQQLERLAEAAGLQMEVRLRPRPRAVSEQFLAVLEFGDLFPRRPKPPLPEPRLVWARTP
ncbi:helix-turn-helix domain-containing protein [Nocardioides sp.]|uniref:helix-turn-helix domain-containing protein n=1 Tax=Nocardioides sp. TaxID=35761 RepID=UPI0035155788